MIKNIVENNKSTNTISERLKKLKELFPNCFNREGEFDISIFEEEIKTNTFITKEGYGLNFLGKNYAKYVASLDTETILVPDEENNNKEINKNSENIYISGDNLDALKHLVKSYSNKIKCIYIDPPYNTGSDGFVYNDKFNLTIEKMIDILDINEEEAKRLYSMTNSCSNSHSAWLTFMYPRLYLSKQLLSDDGSLFISIDEKEYANLKLLCDSLFGEEKIESMIWHKVDNDSGKLKITHRFRNEHEYILCIYKDKEAVYYNKFLTDRNYKNKYTNPDNDPRGEYKQGIISDTEEKSNTNSKNYYEITTPGGRIVTRQWRISKEEFERLDKDNRIYYGKDGNSIPSEKVFINEKGLITPISILDSLGTAKTAGNELLDLFNYKPFTYPKPTGLINYILDRIQFNKDDIVLDFFSGSATTAHSILKYNINNDNIKYIMVQLPELCDIKSEAYKNGYKTIDEIGQERIRRSAKKIKEETNADIDYGFKHYTIKDININTLDKLEKFEPNYVISDATILDEFGINSVLTTWMNEDGYGLTDTYEKLELEDYTAYKCQNTIYLLNWNISDSFIKTLIEKYENEENFDCNRIVMFGYSFTLNEIQTLKDNLQQVKNIKGINVEVITRY